MAKPNFFTKALTHHRAEEYDKAAALYRKTIEAQPSHDAAHYNLGLILQVQGDEKGAAELYRVSTVHNPSVYYGWTQQAYLCRRQGRYEEAEQLLFEAFAVVSDSAKIVRSLGYMYQTLERFDDAIAAYNKAIELKPDDPAGYFSLGEALATAGNLKDAESAYNKALELDPKHYKAMCNMIDVYRDLKRYDEAESIGLRGRKVKPDFAFMANNLGELYLEQGELEKAEAALQDALQLNSELHYAHMNLGKLYHRQGRLEEAEKAMLKAIGLGPKAEFKITFYETLSDIYRAMGRHKEADATYLEFDTLTRAREDGGYKLQGMKAFPKV